jgi:hypothetical protein
VDGSSAKRLRGAVKQLKAAMKGVTRSQKKRKISPECAGALTADLQDAMNRAAQLLAPGRSHGR